MIETFVLVTEQYATLWFGLCDKVHWVYLNAHLYASIELVSQCSNSVSEDVVHQVFIRGTLPACLI